VVDASRVFGPVGLDIGADGPRQVALSIVAELLAFTARRQPRHLCERRQAIHAGHPDDLGREGNGWRGALPLDADCL
jgi:hypothetical protein